MRYNYQNSLAFYHRNFTDGQTTSNQATSSNYNSTRNLLRPNYRDWNNTMLEDSRRKYCESNSEGTGV